MGWSALFKIFGDEELGWLELFKMFGDERGAKPEDSISRLDSMNPDKPDERS